MSIIFEISCWFGIKLKQIFRFARFFLYFNLVFNNNLKCVERILRKGSKNDFIFSFKWDGYQRVSGTLANMVIKFNGNISLLLLFFQKTNKEKLLMLLLHLINKKVPYKDICKQGVTKIQI